MIVGLLFIAIIWCLRGFLSYKQVVHNSCNMGTRSLPDIYTQDLGPAALVLWVYISGKPLVPMLQLYIVARFDKSRLGRKQQANLFSTTNRYPSANN